MAPFDSTGLFTRRVDHPKKNIGDGHLESFSRARELALLSRFASFTRELKKNSPINSSPIYYSKVSGLSKNSPDSKDNGKVWTAHLPEVSVLFFWPSVVRFVCSLVRFALQILREVAGRELGPR